MTQELASHQTTWGDIHVYRKAIRDMVEHFFIAEILFEQNYAAVHGNNYNVDEYNNAAIAEADKFTERMNAIAALMSPEQAKEFAQIAFEETQSLRGEMRRDFKALARRLGVEIRPTQPAYQSHRMGLGELAVRTAVRATVWDIVGSLLRWR
jgi:hypothetical protein